MAALYGQIVDAWQFTIADVGPAGLDQGKGGKFLLTPPATASRSRPAICMFLPELSRGVCLSLCASARQVDERCLHYSKRLRMYSLSEASNPPTQRFVDPGNKRYPTLPYYDERHFDDLHAVASVEPVREQDKVMMGMLTSLGIGRGTSFNPDENPQGDAPGGHRCLVLHAALVDNFRRRNATGLTGTTPPLQSDDNKTFTFTYEDRIDLINRAAEYFWCTYMPKALSDTPATQYLMCLADNNGKLLEAGQLYKLTIPAKMPVKQFWALTVYNRDTMSLSTARAGAPPSPPTISTRWPRIRRQHHPLRGPDRPPGKENNWIPTSGKRPLPAMRFYGPTDELNHKTFKLADFERA
jgi:hypothetical protein